MANVYKKPGTANWYCNYTGANGQRVHRTTKTRKRNEAMAKALEWELESSKVRNAGNDVQARLYTLVAEAGELAFKRRLTLDAARDIVGKMMEASGHDAPDYFTVEGWFAEWLEAKEGTASASSMKTYRLAVKRFVELLGNGASEGIEHVTEKDVRRFRDSERKLGKSPTTCNQMVKIVRMVLRAAHQRGLIRRNPAEGVAPLVNNQRVRRKPFSVTEVEQLIKAASFEWKGAILLGMYGGLRMKDATDLTWEVIDLKAGVISYIPRKTQRSGKVVVLPAHPVLLSWLKKQRKELGVNAHFVFPSLAERQTGGKHGLSREFIELMERAGVEREALPSQGLDSEEKGEGRAVTVRSFHSLRHTAASLMAKGGVAKELRMEVVGHSSEDVHAGYTHHEIEALRKAVNSLPKV
ncbi:tyrosine-type recombinase/integrase [Verrucomicrobiaceae bacterium R5-34]|nr:tyrosine-type recombinase/integrase [Verrucomicrobiaceae bacterium R5-34]